jgi:hypothetical protein
VSQRGPGPCRSRRSSGFHRRLAGTFVSTFDTGTGPRARVVGNVAASLPTSLPRYVHVHMNPANGQAKRDGMGTFTVAGDTCVALWAAYQTWRESRHHALARSAAARSIIIRACEGRHVVSRVIAIALLSALMSTGRGAPAPWVAPHRRVYAATQEHGTDAEAAESAFCSVLMAKAEFGASSDCRSGTPVIHLLFRHLHSQKCKHKSV